MRWTSSQRHNLRSVEDKFNLYNQVIEKNHLKMRGTGTPCTYYKNTSMDDLGNFNNVPTKCFCFAPQISGGAAQPNPRHALCQGTGVLSGYQKYGYKEFVYGTPSIDSHELIKTDGIGYFSENGLNKAFQLSATATTGDLTTAAIPLLRYSGVDRFLVDDKFDVINNKVEYYYSLNADAVLPTVPTWTPITMTPYTFNNMATFQGSGIVIPPSATHVWFKARLRKKVVASQSPTFGNFRFRFKTMPNLVALDPRFKINMPAFLASREQETSFIEQGKTGWETRFPLRWWTLPEVNINNHDVVEFQKGIYAHKKFLVDNIVRNTHGPELQLTNTSFETVIIRDSTDLMGVLYYLT